MPCAVVLMEFCHTKSDSRKYFLKNIGMTFSNAMKYKIVTYIIYTNMSLRDIRRLFIVCQTSAGLFIVCKTFHMFILLIMCYMSRAESDYLILNIT